MRGPCRWVLWDVKDTLLKVRRSVGEQYCREARRSGLSLDAAEVEAAFRRAYREYSSRYPNYGTAQGLCGQSWWLGVVRDTFSQCRVQDPALLDRLSHNLYHNFCNADNWEVFPDAEKALESCSTLGLKLGVVSNFDSRLEGILRSCGLLPHFSFLVTSEGVGVAKPDPAIFRHALRRCDAPATRVAHVGDHYACDYVASRSLGIRGFLLDRRGRERHPDVPPEHRLSSLDELVTSLQKDTG